MESYITYYRVSTKKQGKSGNGLSAQQTTVHNFLQTREAEELETFTEIESGRNTNRTVLKDAVQMCKDSGAKLLVAKLDRLSRNVAFLFALKEELESAGVGFVFADLPDANNTMMLGVMASVAQYEAELISRRTKAGLAEARKKGKQIGSPENLTKEAREKGHQTISQKARNNVDTRKAFHFIQPRREAGESYQSIADQLNEEGYRARRGKEFHPAQVRKIWMRFAD
ncbi:MAG: recombinase family protein [Balneolaceae bacterium]